MKNLKYVVYCRKSTDSEDRQIQSIEDQERELGAMVKRLGLNVIEPFRKETKSAKQPGRPVFNEVIEMIKNGEADGILCWKLNRLSRNPIDGGQIQWLLQQGIIKSIITTSREYLPTDNVLMMSVELGMATQYVIDLSKDVQRGMQSKVDKGWRPGRAPIGYRNDYYAEKGNKKVLVDDERFSLVRKMWDRMLTGFYTVPQVVDYANDVLGLRNHKGSKLSLSQGYKLFTNIFYYGEFYWKGEIYKGKHKPMITIDEFDTVQRIIGKRGKPRPKYKRLPFTGVIECGECGSMITCDEKIKHVKATGRMERYMYHRCTKRKKNARKCKQKPVTYRNLQTQIRDVLDSFEIPQEMYDLALDVLRRENKVEVVTRNQIVDQQQKNYTRCLKSMDNLLSVYISPENAEQTLLSEDEYKEKKKRLHQEKTRIEAEIKRTQNRVDDWYESCEKAFHFARFAREQFEKGDYEVKTQILQSLGQNFVFKDGKLAIKLRTAYEILQNGLENDLLKTARCEPEIYCNPKQKHPLFEDVLASWSG